MSQFPQESTSEMPAQRTHCIHKVIMYGGGPWVQPYELDAMTPVQAGGALHVPPAGDVFLAVVAVTCVIVHG